MTDINQINNNQQFRPSEPKYISQNDFIYFKNELLKDLKNIESKILSKVKAATEQYDTKILNMDSKINSSKTKIFELSSMLNSDKTQNERVNKLFVFKSNTENKISAQEKNIKELRDFLNESIYSMNKILQENISYAGVIGTNSKFPNLHSFIDFVLTSINNMNAFKEKMSAMDIQNYKTKLDKIMKSYKAQIDTFINSTKNMATDTLVIFDNKVNELLNLFEKKLIEEKESLQKNIDEIVIKYDNLKKYITTIKNEFSSKIGIHDDEFNKKLVDLNLKNDKYNCDLDNMNKKLDETNDNIRQICSDYDDRLKEQEYKLSSRINYLFTMIRKKNSNLTIPKDYLFDNFYKKDDKDSNNFKSLDPLINKEHPVESRVKKYIEGEISLNEIMSNKERQRLQNGSDTEKRNILNKILDNEPSLNNIKFIKFEKEDIKNNQEIIDNKLFMNRKKIDSYIIEKENVIINRIPRKQIIKNLLQGSSQPLSYYILKSKEDKNKLNKIRLYQRKTLTSKQKIDLNNSFKKRFHNSTSQFFIKENMEEINNSDNIDLDEIKNKRTFSSKNGKTRNNEQNSMRQNSIMGYNTTDILKDSKTKENNISKTDDEDNSNANKKMNKEINREIYIQDDNKENEYEKKKTKIIHNFNSASKLFDINMKSENILNNKYKINPLNKNFKIIKNTGSPLNQKLKSDREKMKRPLIHYYFNVKNKNK